MDVANGDSAAKFPFIAVSIENGDGEILTKLKLRGTEARSRSGEIARV
ncbi:MAG: hypothetical protein KBF53_01830 [Sphingobium sp.]|nr:hypothetical protein [Sphingobium sp.]